MERMSIVKTDSARDEGRGQGNLVAIGEVTSFSKK